ncbi:MAG: hypothetical protein CMQ81_00750 [Gammaproteobacteria bacterium]|jgi:Fur family zinc uptake transcriptional regulator|nr:hypothetical protein [Gammaproteobacteria bacterium]|tara:strand:- start:1088 stop:1543 length:456 start_codon:yes stop_codon:yes gene_type:complete
MSTCKNHKISIDEALKKAEIICNKKGVKLTKLRQKVLTLILKNHGYVKAYDLLNDLKKNDASAKPPTVYRSLDFLMEHGFIHKIQSLNAFVGCSHPDEHEDCYFLICKECKNIEECCSNTVKKVLTSTSGKNNFSPNQVTLEITGICQDCS